MIATEPEIDVAVQRALDYTHDTLVHAKRIGMGQYHPDRFFWTKHKSQ
jgi:hydroxymethylpyrimidine/phosphomethylpyrimidine kinase